MFITNKHYICIVCLFVCFLLVIVLSVFFWSLFCLFSFGHCFVCLSFGHCFVCLSFGHCFVCLLLVIVLSVYFWSLFCLFSFGHCFVCFLLVIVLSVLHQFTASDYTRYTTLISGNFSFKTFSEIRKTLDNENRWTDNKYLFFFFFKREEGSRHTR